MPENVRPGINPGVEIQLNRFSFQETEIIDRLSKEWYITNGGSEIRIGGSSYRYILMKPTDIYREMFNLEREIIVLFSPYERFEPRTLDAFSTIFNRHEPFRIDRICSVLISKCANIGNEIRNLLKNDKEAQIVVPFYYGELLEKKSDTFFLRNRFKDNFYTRDLFAIGGPLKTDLYFFGRSDLVHALLDRHASNEVSGLFGLRRTGKTSVIFGIQRALQRSEGFSVFIDCQFPAFHMLRWNKALFFILSETKKQLNLKFRLNKEEEFVETKAPSLFEEGLRQIYDELKSKKLLLIFDEVENITFSVSPSPHWKNEMDSIHFWQTLRSLFQRLSHTFSYLIVGTNPLCIEMPTISGVDNPLFGQIPLQYIPRFDVPQTREMIRRLGKIMGIHFDEIIYGKLTEDFGGHPYLMRHVCSVINSIGSKERPTRVDKTLYEKAKQEFLRNYSTYMDMILNVLKEYFPDEYDMLAFLAQGDIETFKSFARDSPLYTNHLIGYGIIEEAIGNYSFRIDSIRDHLLIKQKYRKISMTQDEIWAEISERRNKIEPRLRRLCRFQLLSFYGKTKARDEALKIMNRPRNMALAYDDLFEGGKSEIYFDDLRKIITKHWDCFKNVLGPNVEEIDNQLKTINKLRKGDAHSNPVSHEEMNLFRSCIGAIEKKLEDVTY